MPRDLTAAAFFDVDNTLVHGASIVHFTRGLAAHNYFRYSDILGVVGWSSGHRQGERRRRRRGPGEGAVVHRRPPTSELIDLGEEIYDEYIADKIWPGTQALAQRHLDAGQQVWLVTATPLELAQVIAGRLGLTGALGTVAESVDGVFTGRLVGDILHGPGKAHAVRSLAIREGLDLKRCTAYSDSTTTSRCSRSSARPSPSTPTPTCATSPRYRLGDVRLPHRPQGREVRRFKAALAVGAAGSGAAVAARILRHR